MHEVQSGVPIPKAMRSSTGKRRKYPFEDMEVGDMFFVPDKKKNTLATHASTTGKALGRKFSTRLTFMKQTDDGWVSCDPDDEDAVRGVGVWRTK